MKGVDLGRIPARGLTLSLARWSNAFGGSGRGSRKGVERGRLTRSKDGLRCTWEASFEEFGPHRFRIVATLTGSRAPAASATDWRDAARGARAKGVPDGRSWSFRVSHGTETSDVEAPVAPGAVPTVFQRFIPLLMPRKEGATATFTSVPEDAFPWWRPRVKASFFPLDASPGAKQIRCTGPGELKRGGERLAGWAFEQHGEGDEMERWWLVSDEGTLLAMAAKRTLWIPEDEPVVRAELSADA